MILTTMQGAKNHTSTIIKKEAGGGEEFRILKPVEEGEQITSGNKTGCIGKNFSEGDCKLPYQNIIRSKFLMKEKMIGLVDHVI